MNVNGAIERLEYLKPNTYRFEEKVKWLQTLDMRIKQDIIDTHVGDEVVLEDAYTGITQLIVPEPFTDLYEHWMESKIDYYNREYESYNNAAMKFAEVYQEFERWYNRTHMPKQTKMSVLT